MFDLVAARMRLPFKEIPFAGFAAEGSREGVPFVLANPDAPVSQGVRAMAASIAARLPGRVAVLARR